MDIFKNREALLNIPGELELELSMRNNLSGVQALLGDLFERKTRTLE